MPSSSSQQRRQQRQQRRSTSRDPSKGGDNTGGSGGDDDDVGAGGGRRRGGKADQQHKEQQQQQRTISSSQHHHEDQQQHEEHHQQNNNDHHDNNDNNSRIVQPTYLTKYENDRRTLLRRIKQLALVLQEDENIDPDDPNEWPGLPATASVLVEKFVEHKEKEVRMYACMACMEILAIYAPEIPFDQDEINVIFQQVIQQLGNLGHTTDPCKINYKLYYRMLELLTSVKMGVILVEFTKTMHEDETKPLELLSELVHTLLHAVRTEHTNEVREMVIQAVTACLDEYEGSVRHSHSIPIQLLDELLLCIGQGPTQWVVNPNPQAAADAAAKAAAAAASKKKRKNAAAAAAATGTSRMLMIQQPNPSFYVAAKIVRNSLNRVATPISQLLNGLLNGDSHVVETSSIQSAAASLEKERQVGGPSDGKQDIGEDGGLLPWPKDSVYTIIYELHGVESTILTTVLGTLSCGLKLPDTATRTATTELLGSMFAARNSNLASTFQQCYREWLDREKDVEVTIRKLIVRYCVLIHQQRSHPKDGDVGLPDYIIDHADSTLVRMTQTDQHVDVRLEAINLISDWAFRPHTVVPAKLLKAVGHRVRSKMKEERKCAVIGLGQIYARKYAQPQLDVVQAGGDDCDISVIQDVLRHNCHLDRFRGGRRRSHSPSPRHDKEGNEECYRWIPSLVFESACFTDQADTELRSRVVQVVDEILLHKKLTSTARAVGVTMILDSITGEGESLLADAGRSTNAYKMFRELFTQRARLQAAVGDYINARAEAKDSESGSEEALVADVKARDLLDRVATLTAPPTGTKTSLKEILDSLHQARDRRIFQILSTISDPLQKENTRKRALDELPKRTKSLGDAVSQWVRQLVRRCIMGFLDSETIHHCVVLARECFHVGDVPTCAALLASVKTAVSIFSTLCSPPQTLSMLTDLLSDALAVTARDRKAELQETGIVSALSSLLSTVDTKSTSKLADKPIGSHSSLDHLHKQLIQLCTRNGAPDQARNAVYALVRVLLPAEQKQTPKSPTSSQKEVEAVSPILKALTSPSRMTIGEEGGKSSNVISILSALSALADSAPEAFITGSRGQKAIQFALETVLLGRGYHAADESDSDEEDESDAEPETPSKSRARTSSAKKRQSQNRSQAEKPISLLQDESLSIPCRRVCAAVEFVVSIIRSSIFSLKKTRNKSFSGAVQSELADHAASIFKILHQILSDNGLPASNRDRRACRSPLERAALRQCAAIHLLRLCDPRVTLEKNFLSLAMWHTLGDAFLDPEASVREAVLQEHSRFLCGSGVYGAEGSPLPAQAPSLRLVAFIVLYSDGIHSDNDAANGNAANVGNKMRAQLKNDALLCVEKLRTLCETLYSQCRASGDSKIREFESRHKTQTMPEYMVPYAFHLLTHRRETPCEESLNCHGSDVLAVDADSQRKVLTSRLTLLFEPLVKSLGDSADNISFLLRMSELVVRLRTVDAAAPSSKRISSIGSESSNDTKPRADDDRAHLLASRLKEISGAARDVLLGFVKKDVNLSLHPGTILFPNHLFRQVSSPVTRLASRRPASTKYSQNSETTVSSEEAQHSSMETVASGRKTQTAEKRKHNSLEEALTPSGKLDSTKKRKQQTLQETVTPSHKVRSVQKPKLPSPIRSSLKKGPSKLGRVHFSPECQQSGQRAALPSGEGARPEQFGGMSPIPKSKSPGSSSRSSGDPTLGTAPPSCLKTSTILSSTAPDNSSEEHSPMMPPPGDIPNRGLPLDGESSSDPVSQESSAALSDASIRRITRSQVRTQSQSQDSVPSVPARLDGDRHSLRQSQDSVPSKTQSQDSGQSRYSSLSKSSDEHNSSLKETPSQKQQQHEKKKRKVGTPVVPKSISISRRTTTSGGTASASQRSGKSSSTTWARKTDLSGSAAADSENRPTRRNNISNKRSIGSSYNITGGEKASSSELKSASRGGEDEENVVDGSKASSSNHRRRRRRRRIIRQT